MDYRFWAFSKEKVGAACWGANSAVSGAMVILEPWAENFSWATLLPVGAVFLGVLLSFMVKTVLARQSIDHGGLPASITPFNLLLCLIGKTGAVALYGEYCCHWHNDGACNNGQSQSILRSRCLFLFNHLTTPSFHQCISRLIVFSWVPPGGRLWL